MGVIKPYRQLNKRQIEQQADKVLAAMQDQDYMPKKWTNLAERTADFFDLGIAWASFDPEQDGIVAAKIYPTEKQIELNQDFKALDTNEQNHLLMPLSRTQIRTRSVKSKSQIQCTLYLGDDFQ